MLSDNNEQSVQQKHISQGEAFILKYDYQTERWTETLSKAFPKFGFAEPGQIKIVLAVKKQFILQLTDWKHERLNTPTS